MERLQRVLSSSGIASRRKAEELIVAGRVRVDGVIVTQLGTQVDAERQKIEVDGKLIPRARLRYIVLHKPSGYITTTADERGRYTVMDLVPVDERVVPVGRLDRQTEGLLLLTNDGEIAHRVMHPRFEIEKEYEALLDGHPPAELLERVRRGIVIDGQRTRPAVVRPMRNTEDGTVVKVVLHEGRNRVVRKMFEEIGYPVLRLIRVRVGPLQLGSIPRGTWRDLTDGELSQLREAVHMVDEDIVSEARYEDDRRTGRADIPRFAPPGRGPGRVTGPPRGRGGEQGGERRTTPARGPRQQRRPDGPPARPAGPRRDEDDTARPARPAPRGRPSDPRRDENPVNRRDRPGPHGRPGGPRRDDAPAKRQDRSTGPRPERGRTSRDERPEGPRRDDSPANRRDRPAPAGRPTGPRRDDRPADRRERPAPPGRPPGGTGQRTDQQSEGERRSGPAQKPRRPGGGSGKPPIHNRDRRTGGSGQEHGRRDRRPPA